MTDKQMKNISKKDPLKHSTKKAKSPSSSTHDEVLKKLDKIIDMLHKLYDLENESIKWAKSLEHTR
jgi:hypothetical protein